MEEEEDHCFYVESEKNIDMLFETNQVSSLFGNLVSPLKTVPGNLLF